MSARRRILLAASVVLLATVAATLSTPRGRNLAWAAYTRARGRATVEQRLAEVGPGARAELHRLFAEAGLEYPPPRVALVAMKAERSLQVYAPVGASWRRVATFDILGSSGGPGPKLLQGDQQVPEGVYRIESLNPNSRYHLALRVGYPNEFDIQRAAADGRTRIGSDIMIHGGSLSIGCLAMGDEVIEQLFVLVADVGVDSVELVIVPQDLRHGSSDIPESAPAWLPELYARLRTELERYPDS